MEPAAELAPGPTDGRSLVSVAGDPSGAAGRPKITRWPLFIAESTNDGRAGSGVFTTGPRGAGANGEITPPCLDLVGLPAPKSLAFFFASKDRTPFYSYLPVGDGEFCIEARLHPFFDEFVTKRFHSSNERRRVLIRQKNACKDENSTPFTWLTNFSLSDSINFAKIVYFFQVSAGI